MDEESVRAFSIDRSYKWRNVTFLIIYMYYIS